MTLFAQAFSQQSAEPELVEGQEDLATVAQLEEDNGELVEAAAEVEKEANMQSDLEERVEVAEEIQTTLQGMVSAGEGMDRRTALAYQQAFKGLIGTVLPNPVGTVENFGGDAQRLEATKRTLQGIADTLKKIWEAIKAAVVRGIAAIKDFFAKLFGGTDSLKKRAEALRKKIADAKSEGKEAPSEKIKVSGGVRLHVSGSMEPSAVKTGLALAANEISETANKLLEGAGDYYQTLAKDLKSTNESVVEKFISKGTKNNIDKSVASLGSAVSLALRMKGKPLPGGKAIIVEVGSNSEEEKSLAGKIYIGDAPKAEWKESTEVAAPSLADLEAMLTSIESMIAKMEGEKKDAEKLASDRDAAIKAGDELIKAGEAGKLSQSWDQAKLSAALRLTNMSFNRTLSSLNSYLFGVSRAGLQYVDSCVSSYKKKAA
jgi:hypothetical protein